MHLFKDKEIDRMKNITNRMKFFTTILSTAVLVLTGCEMQPKENQAQDTAVYVTANVSSKQYQEALYQRPGGNGAPYTINSIERNGNILLVEVSYSGGCKPHEFSAVWDGIALFTNPPIIPVILKHDANGDACEAYLTETLEIDLSTLVKDQELLNKAVISLINGTSDQEISEELNDSVTFDLF